MTEYMTEQEQIEQLKNWVKQYGLTVLTGILIAAAALFSWHSWLQHQNKTLAQASYIYDNMLTLKTQNNPEKAKQLAQQLLHDFNHTPYAQMAALLISNYDVNEKKYSEALQQLNWVAKHAASKNMQDIARLRASRILILQNKADDALNMLASIKSVAFDTLKNELKGDIYLKQKDSAKARSAYQDALLTTPAQDATEKALLQMKIDNLTTVSDLIS